MVCANCGTPMNYIRRFLPDKAYEVWRCPNCWAESERIPYKLGDEKLKQNKRRKAT